ncbi:MAG: hypothetical protein ABW166_10685 [Sedimenticola sp.]
MIDGLFAQTGDGVHLYEATGLSDQVIQQAQERIRKRGYVCSFGVDCFRRLMRSMGWIFYLL